MAPPPRLLTSLLLLGAGIFSVSLSAQTRADACAALLQSDRPNEAETCARGVLTGDPRNALAFEIVGAVRLRAGDASTAETMLRAAIRSEPGLLGASLSLVNALTTQQKYTQAESMLRKVQHMAPGLVDVCLLQVHLDGAEGHFKQALAHAKPCLSQMRQDESELTMLVADSLEADDAGMLRGFLKDWSALAQPSVAPTIALANLLIRHGRNDEALAVLSLPAVRSQADFDVYYLRGELSLHKGAFANARQELEAALELQPGCGRCLAGLARLADMAGEPGAAAAMFLRAETLLPNDPGVSLGLGKCLLELDEPEKAVPKLEAAVASDPKSESSQYVLASAYTSVKQYERALSILQRLATAHPEKPLFPYSVGAVRYLKGDYPAAEQALRQSLRLEPGGVGALYYLGLTLRKEGQMVEAEAAFHQLLLQSSQHVEGLAALGETLMAQRRYAEARPFLEEAVQADPASVNAHYVLGRVLARLDLKQASEEQFAIVKRLNSTDSRH